MGAHSFYLGPGKPVLRVIGWDDLVAAAQAGVLAETQWVELKAALPASANAANLELAKDLASLSVDGGVYIVGVSNPGNHADHIVGTTDDLVVGVAGVDGGESLGDAVQSLLTQRVLTGRRKCAFDNALRRGVLPGRPGRRFHRR